MFVVISKYLIPKGYRGITLFPFVILKNDGDKKNSVLLLHEKIHIKQQLELLIVPFFVFYALEFLVRLIQYRNKKMAYRNISFEREAYANENNSDYLKSRSFWQFIKYI